MIHLKHSTKLNRALLCTLITAIITVAWLTSANAQSHHAVQKTKATVKEADNIKTILGDVVPFGNGTARSWVKKDATGAYTAVGVTLTEAAMQGLPEDVTPGLVWMVEYVLNLPTEASDLPFNHIGINWNPKGHMPSGVYNVPHFDFHFYTTTRDIRNKITARGKDLETCRNAPAKGEVPEGYMFAPESEEPGMGGHWVDGGSHEFHGKDFTATFIYGSYDSKVIFWEPMITKKYIESKPNISIPLKVPQSYAIAGYYPTTYSILYDEQRKEHTIALEGMKMRHAIAAK